jgi:hypothetical protein
VRWNFDETESGQHHRYIGNAQFVGDSDGDSEVVNNWTLRELISQTNGDVAFMKIDCEAASTTCCAHTRSRTSARYGAS